MTKTNQKTALYQWNTNNVRVTEGNSLRELQANNGIYRGWNIYPMASGYGIRKEGWQGYANFKTIENAKARIDAIVG